MCVRLLVRGEGLSLRLTPRGRSWEDEGGLAFPPSSHLRDNV
jgi:hypothetical protein